MYNRWYKYDNNVWYVAIWYKCNIVYSTYHASMAGHMYIIAPFIFYRWYLSMAK